MNEELYIKQRVDEQIEWHSSKSCLNKILHKTLSITEICAAALIPFVSGIENHEFNTSLIVGGLGVFITVTSSSKSLFKFHEKWIQYRSTSEMLKHEKLLFATRTTPYNTNNAFDTFVQRIEQLLMKENSSWINLTKNATPGAEQSPTHS